MYFVFITRNVRFVRRKETQMT